jgi:subtilase family serine protease
MTLAAVSSLAASVVVAPTAQARPTPAAIPNSKPTWVNSAKPLARTSGNAPVNLRVYLAPNGGLAAEKAFALSLATKGSANYHQFLSAAQFTARFAPTGAAVQAVRAWLVSSGLKVASVQSDHRYISVTGTVAAAQRAFGTTVNTYRHNGEVVSAQSTALSAPSDVVGDVLAVSGLDTSTHLVKPANIPPSSGFRNARPCSTYYGQLTAKYQADFSTPLPKFNGKYLPYAICGYTGPFFRAAYEQNNSLDGSGVTVAITDAYASPTIVQDAKKYSGRNGDGSYAPGQLTQSNSSTVGNFAQCDPSGWYGEETLDVEAVHAMAPGANIRYYGARSCLDNDLLDSLARVVDEDTASIVTNSWGEPEEGETSDTVAAYEQVFLQGAIQGITFMFSSGDNGDELQNTGVRQADYPTSDPYVTSVGGTSTAIDGNGNLVGQTGWGTEKYALGNGTWNFLFFQYGAGGGYSHLFNKPSYQSSAVPGAYRGVPDVAMDADPTTGMLIGQTQAFPEGVHYDEYRIGGTSLASPLFAGMTALTLENGGTRAGLLNPVIYGVAGPDTFNDVKSNPLGGGNVRVDNANGVDASDGLVYSVRSFNQDSSLFVKPGWDDVTGVGSPNVGWLAALNN